MSRTPNPILAYWERTLRRGPVGRENFLTEFFAAALDTSPEFATSYVHLVLEKHAKARKWGGQLRITKVTTANIYSGGVRPDMVLTLSTRTGEKTIWCEHKWTAREGKTTAPQLVRYLRDDRSDAVVYVRGDFRGYDLEKLGSEAREHFEKFVQPWPRYRALQSVREGKPDRTWGCFVWDDFARIIWRRANQPVVGWLDEVWRSKVWKDPPKRRRA